MNQIKDPQTQWDEALMMALKFYEISNFRQWNEEDALRRYFSHQSTHVAVKTIARMILDDKAPKDQSGHDSN